MAERIRTSISSFSGLIFIITHPAGSVWVCFLVLKLPAILKILRAVFDYFTCYIELINLLHDLFWSNLYMVAFLQLLANPKPGDTVSKSSKSTHP